MATLVTNTVGDVAIDGATNGPYRASGSELVLFVHDPTVPELQAYESTDDGATWSLADSWTLPQAGGGWDLRINQSWSVSELFHIGFCTDDGFGNGSAYYQSYDAGTSVFGTQETLFTNDGSHPDPLPVLVWQKEVTGNDPDLTFLELNQNTSILYSHTRTNGSWTVDTTGDDFSGSSFINQAEAAYQPDEGRACVVYGSSGLPYECRFLADDMTWSGAEVLGTPDEQYVRGVGWCNPSDPHYTAILQWDAMYAAYRTPDGTWSYEHLLQTGDTMRPGRSYGNETRAFFPVAATDMYVETIDVADGTVLDSATLDWTPDRAGLFRTMGPEVDRYTNRVMFAYEDANGDVYFETMAVDAPEGQVLEGDTTAEIVDGGAGPWRATNGDLLAFLYDPSVDEVWVYKSTDAGVTWALEATWQQTSVPSLYSVTVQRDPDDDDLFHVVMSFEDAGLDNGAMHYNTYQHGVGWGTSEEVTSGAGERCRNGTVAKMASGELALTYDIAFTQTYLARRDTGGTWTARHQTMASGYGVYGMAYDAVNDRAFMWRSNRTFQTVESDLTPGTEETLPAGSPGDNGDGLAVWAGSGVPEYVVAGYDFGGGNLSMAHRQHDETTWVQETWGGSYGYSASLARHDAASLTLFYVAHPDADDNLRARLYRLDTDTFDAQDVVETPTAVPLSVEGAADVPVGSTELLMLYSGVDDSGWYFHRMTVPLEQSAGEVAAAASSRVKLAGQLAVPDADDANPGGWTDEGGAGTDLWASVDDGQDVDDADYVQSP